MVKNVHKSPPKGKPKNRSQYADGENYKFPIDAKHIRAAVSRYNQGNRSDYTESKWAAMGRRIASAARRLIGGAYKLIDGKVKRTGVATAEWDADVLLLAGALGEVGSEIADALIDYFASDEAAEEWDGADEIAVAEEAEAMLYRDFPFGLIPVTPVIGEELSVDGVPVFRYTSMVIPGDAVSKNTVPGKRGPTYYAGSRIGQYLADNTALLQAMEARGERVTVYPRHAAAMLDASLPSGWVESYFTRPSQTRAGLEDLHYSALIPLTTEGLDLRMKMQSRLVRFSSLRTQPSPAFETKPVTLNGRVVEEAVKLPIAGIDLVATQPGLPVSALQILEEGYTLGDAPPSDEPEPPQRERRSFFVPGAARSTAGHEEISMNKCPFCKADLTAETAEAHLGEHATESAAVREELKTAKKAVNKLNARVADLTEQVAQAKQTTPPAPVVSGVEEAIAAVKAEFAEKMAELRAENAELRAASAANEETMAEMAKFRTERAINAKVAEVYAAARNRNAGLADYILPLVQEEASKLTDAAGVAILWSNTVEEHADAYYRQATRLAAGRGYVHLPVPTPQRAAAGAGTEEQQPPAGGNGTQQRAAEEGENGDRFANLSDGARSIVSTWR